MLNKIKAQLMHLHMPAKVYVVLAVIAIVMNFMYMTWHHLLFSLVFILGWTLFIEYIGKRGVQGGYKSAGWLLAILPFAVMFYVKSAMMNHMTAGVAAMLSKGASVVTPSSGTGKK